MNKRKKPEYSVGYRKPPLHAQFKPGRSGNPAGRPKKKTASIAESIEKELNSLVTLREGGKLRRMTKSQAIAKQQTNKALTGDPRATAIVLKAQAQGSVNKTDGLSPWLQEFRAFHAEHQASKQSGSQLPEGVSGLADSAEKE